MCWQVDLFRCPEAFKAVTERRGHGGHPEENVLILPMPSGVLKGEDI